MKILSIGNSFSEDAHRWLHRLAKTNGICIETANLYIGGCSLETHRTNMIQNNAYYDLQLNGNAGERKIGITEALEMDTWDVITLQQVSQLSGLWDTFEPYLSNLASVVMKAQPNAKLYFHQTWAYEIDSDHGGFANYDRDQQQMYDHIINASEKAAKTIDAEIIPVGRAIQAMRENIPEFDYPNGGISLCRDGYHLTFDYGRYAAAATWFHTLTGMKVQENEFENFDPHLLKQILAVVNEI